jgi:hypothetical protein
MTVLVDRIRKSPAIAASVVLGVAAVAAVLFFAGGGEGQPDPGVPVSADSVPTKVAETPVVAPASADSAREAQRVADSVTRADSIAAARRAARARADSLAEARRLAQARADSIAAARTARATENALRKNTPPVVTSPVQSGQTAQRPSADTAKLVQGVPDPRYSPYSNSNTAAVPPQTPPTNPPPVTFGAAVAREVQRLADFFNAGDRRNVSRVLTTDETDKIWRKLDGHPQISAAAKVVDLNQADSTANFFLVVTDRASQAYLFSGEFKARFIPIPNGLRFLTVTPQR